MCRWVDEPMKRVLTSMYNILLTKSTNYLEPGKTICRNNFDTAMIENSLLVRAATMDELTKTEMKPFL